MSKLSQNYATASVAYRGSDDPGEPRQGSSKKCNYKNSNAVNRSRFSNEAFGLPWRPRSGSPGATSRDHDHGSGSSSGALGFHECSSGALFFHSVALAPAPASVRFYTLILSIALVCLKLNGKWNAVYQAHKTERMYQTYLNRLIW